MKSICISDEKRSQDLKVFSQYTVNVSHFIEDTIKDNPIKQKEGRGGIETIVAKTLKHT